MATRRFFAFMEAGVTPTAWSRSQVAWSKRETYMCEFMWAVKSYSEARTAPLKVWIQSAMLSLLCLFATRTTGRQASVVPAQTARWRHLSYNCCASRSFCGSVQGWGEVLVDPGDD